MTSINNTGLQTFIEPKQQKNRRAHFEIDNYQKDTNQNCLKNGNF